MNLLVNKLFSKIKTCEHLSRISSNLVTWLLSIGRREESAQVWLVSDSAYLNMHQMQWFMVTYAAFIATKVKLCKRRSRDIGSPRGDKVREHSIFTSSYVPMFYFLVYAEQYNHVM